MKRLSSTTSIPAVDTSASTSIKIMMTFSDNTQEKIPWINLFLSSTPQKERKQSHWIDKKLKKMGR